MGIIGKAVENAAKSLLKDAAIAASVEAVEKAGKKTKPMRDAFGNAVDKTLKDREIRHQQMEEEYLAGLRGNICLFIQVTGYSGDLFCITDYNGRIKYCVKGSYGRRSGKATLQLMDVNKAIIASVKKVFLSLRAPVIHEFRPGDYEIKTYGGRTVTLKTKMTSNRERYYVEPYGWVVAKDNLMGGEYTLIDRGYKVAHISRRRGYEKPTYILSFQNGQLELMALMIMLTVICRED